MTHTTAIEARRCQRLRAALNEARADQQDLAREIQAHFGRDGLADSFREVSQASAVAIGRAHSRQRAFGSAFARWESQHPRAAAPRQMHASEAAQACHG